MDEVFTGLGLTLTEEVPLEDEAATLAFGQRMARSARAGDFLGLVGNLGAGKTTFARGFVAELDPDQEATSPSYTLVNVYECEPPVFHFDLWRLEDVDSLESVGYWDYLDQPGIALVEWLDRIPLAWPGSGTVVELVTDGTGRRAKIWASAPG